MIDKERKVDLSKISETDLKELEQFLGQKVREICDEACDKVNKLLNIYGLFAHMQIIIDEKPLQKAPPVEQAEKSLSEVPEVDGKRGKPKKASQSLQ